MIPSDPYAPPIAPPGAEAVTTAGVPEGAVAALRSTRPWVRLLSIIGFVVAALMFFGGLAVLLGGGAMLMGGLGGGAGAAEGGMMAAIAVLYILLAFLYLLPSLYLYRYARAITRLTAGGGAVALVDALGHQRAFWRLAGILTLAMMALYAVALVAVAVGAAMGAFGP